MLFDLVLVPTNDDLLLVQVPYCKDCFIKKLRPLQIWKNNDNIKDVRHVRIKCECNFKKNEL